MNEIPIVRHFLPCDDIVMSADGERYSLVNIIHAIRPLPGIHYPRRHPMICLFAQMTSGRGSHSFRIDLVRGTGPNETMIYSTPNRVYDLGTDPLTVFGLPIRIENVPFPEAGQYEFQLVCDGQVIAQAPVELRESQ